MSGQHDRQDEHLTGQSPSQAGHHPLTSHYFEPCVDSGSLFCSHHVKLQPPQYYSHLVWPAKSFGSHFLIYKTLLSQPRLISGQTCITEVPLLLVCKWRHGGHVGGQEQKHFSPLGNELYFDANLAKKFLLY